MTFRTKENLVMAAITLVVIGIIVASIAAINSGLEQQGKRRAEQHQLVQGICTLTGNEVNHTTQDLCGLAQDVTHTEFLCMKVTHAAGWSSTFCWVEDK